MSISKPAEHKKGSHASGEGEEDDDLKPVEPAGPAKSKLDFHQMALFGFNDVEQPKKYGNVETVRDAGGKAGGAAGRRRSKNATVVYGADSDDDLDDTDYHQDYYDQYAADADVSDEDDDEGDEHTTEFGHDEGMHYYDYTETLADIDEDWEDEEEEEDEEDSEEREEAEREARIIAEMERERLREIRLQEILKKKEDLVERYLKVARVMINLRKKNIYLQDYLYHLALRKGLLRGDATGNRAGATNEDSDTFTVKFAKAQQKREKKKNNSMAARFARFLRKTGHFWDPEDDQHRDHIHHHGVHHTHPYQSQHHHHHHRGKNLMRGHAQKDGQFRNRISRHYNVFRSNTQHGKTDAHHQQHQHHIHVKHTHTKQLPSTAVTKGDPSKACVFGKDCRHVSEKQELRLHAKMMRQKVREKLRKESKTELSDSNFRRRGTRKPMSLKEILEMKAAATIKKLMKGPTDALETFEKHRCKMAKKKQLIKIGRLLQRQYAGTSLIDPERVHLISFVEHSVTQQNLAKKKALRKKKHQQEKEIKSMGIQHMNHQWFKALDRIRDLRLKKAKLEQEHRLELMRKVKHWHVWERRDMTALEAVYDFVTNLSSKVMMSKRETEHFSVGIHQFWKQLHSLHNTVLQQLIRLFKARSMLYMAQRKVKDNATVSTPMKGFTIADYQRMIIENEESHQKLKERQEHLRQQHEKLKDYVEKVANSHMKKQRTWGTLRAGRHDMKQLFELCRHERNNLLRKVREIRRTEKRHRRFFTQVSVMGNKNCLKDYQKVHGRVQELDDRQRKLHNELQQTETVYRVLKVKVTDAQKRIDEAEKERREKVLKDDMDFYKDTMKQRINPKLPGTVHAANMMSRKSMEKLYSHGEKDKERCGYYFIGSTSPKSIERKQEKLPPIGRKPK